MRAGRFRGAHTLRSRGFHLDFAFPGIALIHAAFRATFQERPRFCRSCMNIDERASNAPPIFTRGLCRGCSLLQQYKQLATPAAAQAIQTAVAFLGHFCRAA